MRLTQTWDLIGNRLSVSATRFDEFGAPVPDFTNAYVYDTLYRMTRIDQTGPNVVPKRIELGYNDIGQFTRIDRFAAPLAGGSFNLIASSTYSYDPLARLIGLDHAATLNSQLSTLNSLSYSHDRLNRITSVTSTNEQTADYGYDATSQLTGADYTDATRTDESFSYDLNGNRAAPSNADYATGPNNQLLETAGQRFTYDGEGNRLTETDKATGEVREYTWDHRNRLTFVTTKNAAGTPTKIVAYTYDVANRRIAKTVDANASGTIDLGDLAERFVYDHTSGLYLPAVATSQTPVDHIALVFDGQGNLVERDVHGPSADFILARETINAATGLPEAVLLDLGDNLGTPRTVIATDPATGQVTGTKILRYDSFGQIVDDSNVIIPIRYAFTGREFDPETGLYYYRARLYDVHTGRFVSEDPIGFGSRDVNLNRYCGNRPVSAVDSTGLVVWYGKYCGPGTNLPSTPWGWFLIPTVGLDDCCFDHDLCYKYGCNANWQQSLPFCGTTCTTQCDKALCTCAWDVDCASLFQGDPLEEAKCYGYRALILSYFCPAYIPPIIW